MQQFRIGLGCMRLSTEAVDPDSAQPVIAAALDAGFTIFDTARSYTSAGGELGHNERLLAEAVRSHPRGQTVRIITKCGMRRDGGAWIPDGRASRIAEDVEASVEVLGGIPIDVLLLHAPDPRVSLSTTARALSRIHEARLVRSIGVSNVSRKQLEEIAAHVPIKAVEVALGAYDDFPIRSGVVAYCIDHRIEILAHAPLGGPGRARRLARDPQLTAIAARYGVATGADVFLSYLLAVRPEIVPIVGVRRAETIARIAAAATLCLNDEDLARMDARFPSLGALRKPPAPAVSRDAEIVMIMGIAGAGKSRAAESYVARGYERLNRDTVGGTLRGIANRLDEKFAGGTNRFVLDNTYVTRASRSDVLRVAARHGARVRCVFFDTPLHEAQINVVLRWLDKFGRVLTPHDPDWLAPHNLSRMIRDLEPPERAEGFSDIESVPFVREHPPGGRSALFVSLDAVKTNPLSPFLRGVAGDTPCLLYGWKPDHDDTSMKALRAIVESTALQTGHMIEVACCPHPAGPPTCWCRPPLPALLLTYARRHTVDFRASTLFGSSATDRTIARVLGMSYRNEP